jgi:hypothetical protein
MSQLRQLYVNFGSMVGRESESRARWIKEDGCQVEEYERIVRWAATHSRLVLTHIPVHVGYHATSNPRADLND